MSAMEPRSPICIGRFEAGLPPDLEIEGRSQSIYGVSAHATPLPKDGFGPYWQQRLGGLKSGNGFQRIADLEGDAKGAWVTDGLTGVRLEAAKEFGDYAFSAGFTGDKGREAIIQKLISNVIASYQPNGHAGFCVEHGVITSELGNAETASLLMKHETLGDLSIKFLTQTVKSPVPDERLSDAREIEEAIPGSKLATIISRRRKVADIEGLEERFGLSPPNSPPLVRFSWKCSGESLRAQIPQIVIIGVAHKENQPQLAAAWDFFLDSVRKVPVAPGSAR